MPLQSQSVDVPLIALKQSWPVTAGIAGRLTRLNNAIAKRWLAKESGVTLRVEKRDGFEPFSSTVRDDDGNTSSKTLSGVSMLASRNQQLIALAGASIFACSRSNLDWISPSYVCPVNKLTESLLVGHGTIADVDTLPDSCYISGLTLTTWTEVTGGSASNYYQVTDDDGTLIRKPTQIGTGVGFFPGVSTKCVSDGSRFWVVVNPSISATYGVFVYDLNGTLLASDTASIPVDAAYLDITANTESGSNGLVFIQRSGAGPNFSTRKVTWNGAAIVVSAPVASAAKASTGRLAFLKNSESNHKYYAVTVDGAGPYDFYLWEIDDVTLAATSTTIKIGNTVAPIEITGWAKPSSNFYTVCLSYLNTTPVTSFPQSNYTEVWKVVAGVPTLARTQIGLTAVSRPFALDGKYYAVWFYQSDPSTASLANNIQQSTFFLFDLDTSGTYQVCGEWEIGNAYADWQRASGTNSWFQVSSPFVKQDGTTHVALNFRARSYTTKVTLAVGKSGDNVFGNAAVNTVGIKDFGFESVLNQGVEFANEVLIPGPRTTSWTGAPTNHGISLVPEMLPPVAAAAGAGLSQNATYEVVCVAEWTDGNGQRVRSIAGPPFSFQTTAGQRQATYSGFNIQTDTGKDNLTISLYRTAFVGGIQSTQHYKVTNDLVPLINAPGTVLWTFVDTMTDSAASQNEILYVDKGFLDRYPCPPFSQGTSDAQRAYVVGLDGAVWFSGSKTEGDATWFNPLFRLLLNNDTAKACALLDTTLVIFGASNNIYVVPVNALPANDGSGSIPIPVQLPLTHGCAGPVVSYSDGIMFPSTQGGIWTLTRDLKDAFIGKDVKLDVETAGAVIGMAVDKNQRIGCLLENGTFVVYDSVVGAWYNWSLDSAAVCVGANQGEFVVGQSNVVQHQSPGVVTDGGVAAVITNFKVQFPLGGVKNFKRIWDMQIEGEYRGEHELTVVGYFDNNLGTVVETYEFEPDPLVPYNYDLPPKVEECSNLTLEFTDSFPVSPSLGFALELVSFELALERGLTRLAPSTRRKSAT